MAGTNSETTADPTDVIGRRIGAYLVDGVISTIVLLAVLIPLFTSQVDRRTFPSGQAAVEHCDLDDGDDAGRTDAGPHVCIPVGDTSYEFGASDLTRSFLLLYAVSFVTGGLNSIVLQGLAGATLGKFAFRLRVVREDGSPIGLGWSFLRNLVGAVDGLGGGVVGLIAVCTTRGHRRVGDMVASSYVVDRAAMGSPVLLPPAPERRRPYGPPPGGPTWDPSRQAYLQYDEHRRTWLQWDPASSTWRPLPPAPRPG